MKLTELKATISDLVPSDSKPVVIYTELFSVARAIEYPLRELAVGITDVLFDALGPDRTILMPAYSKGFTDGMINLDEEPCTSGAVNEHFRKMPGVIRSGSAFFSFCVRGPLAAEIEPMFPKDAWGEGSVFEWLEKKDAHILMFGAHWDECSIKHRAEWIAKVPYRYVKHFAGTAIRHGKRFPLEERLFVRRLNPEVRNEWHGLEDILNRAGMRRVRLGSGQISVISTARLLAEMGADLKKDPFVFVKNREVVRDYFENNKG